MRKIPAGIMIFVVGVVCGLIFTYGSIHAQGSIDEGAIMAKLDEISRGQAEIVTVVNSMKEDIQTIRLRITQMQ